MMVSVHILRLIKGLTLVAITLIVFTLGAFAFSFAAQYSLFGWLLAGFIGLALCYAIGAVIPDRPRY